MTHATPKSKNTTGAGMMLSVACICNLMEHQNEPLSLLSPYLWHNSDNTRSCRSHSSRLVALSCRSDSRGYGGHFLDFLHVRQ
jgi:hypothetical protein